LQCLIRKCKEEVKEAGILTSVGLAVGGFVGIAVGVLVGSVVGC
jgi:hypothetical protein